MTIYSGSSVGYFQGNYYNPYDHPIREYDSDFVTERFERDGRVIESEKWWIFIALRNKLMGKSIVDVELIYDNYDDPDDEPEGILTIRLNDGTEIKSRYIDVDDIATVAPSWANK